MPLATAITAVSPMVFLGIIGVFVGAVALHAQSYMRKYGTVTSRSAQSLGYGIGGEDGSHGGCGDSAGHGSCDGGSADGGH